MGAMAEGHDALVTRFHTAYDAQDSPALAAFAHPHLEIRNPRGKRFRGKARAAVAAASPAATA